MLEQLESLHSKFSEGNSFYHGLFFCTSSKKSK